MASPTIGSYIVLDGYCFADTDNYPCGQDGVSEYCIQNHMCPYFDWARMTYRELLEDVPLYYILRDKLFKAIEAWWWWLHWNVYFRWTKKNKEAGEMIDKMFTLAPKFSPDFLEKQAEFKVWQESLKGNVIDSDLEIDAWGVDDE